MSKGASWRAATGLGAATVLSRVLGMVRDIAMLALLGAGVHGSAFVVAFAIPNLFRRLFGEGVLTSATLPVLAEADNATPTRMWALLRQVLRRMALWLGGSLVLLMVLSASLALILPAGTRWQMTAYYTGAMLPYALLVCATAMFAAALQVRDRFAVPAWSPIILNLSFLAIIGALAWRGLDDPAQVGWWLCGAVLLGGIGQLTLAFWAARQQGWAERKTQAARSEDMSEIGRLMWVGLIGAAAFPLNLLLARLFSLAADPGAAAHFYIANRLIELPVGVFAASLNTVGFAALARAASQKDAVAFSQTLREAGHFNLLLALPAALGLGILAAPITQLLFGYGRMTAADLAVASQLLAIMSPTVVLWGLAALGTRALHAQKQMAVAARRAWAYLALQTLFTVVLLPFFGILGVAWAHLIASFLYLGLLGWAVRPYLGNASGPKHPWGWLLLALLWVAAVAWAGRLWVGHDGAVSSVAVQASQILLIVGVAAGGYFGLLWLGGERRWLALLRR